MDDLSIASIRSSISRATGGRHRAELLVTLSRTLRQADPAGARAAAGEALEICSDDARCSEMLRMHAHLALGESLHPLAEYEQSIAHFRAALRIAGESGDRSGGARAALGLGRVDVRLGETERALGWFAIAADTYERLGARADLIRAIDAMGHARISRNEVPEALRLLQRGLALITGPQEESIRASLLYNLGRIWCELEQYERALAALEESLLIRRRDGDRLGEGATLSVIAIVHEMRGETNRALRMQTELLALQRRLGDRSGEILALSSIGMLHCALGDIDRGLDDLAGALELATELALPDLQTGILYEIGRIESGRRNDPIAIENLVRALAVARQIGYQALELEIRRHLAGALDREQRTDESIEHYRYVALHAGGSPTNRHHAEIADIMRNVPETAAVMTTTEGEIRLAHAGFLGMLATRFPQLSSSERRVCALLRLDLSSKEIALILSCATETVKTHRRRIRRKLDLPKDRSLAGFLQMVR